MENEIVDFNKNCYLMDGQPTWLLSGEMHYFKMTRGDWRRRLVQLKTAGFNTVSVYMPWNYHELSEGEWDFSDDRDVEYFLKLAAELGIYVVARPGPYICNEWHAGGFPAWLSAKKGMRIRTKDPKFLAYVDQWWDKIMPIIGRYQLGRDGTVILVQVENEYGHYGEGQEAEYVYHLRDGVRERGVTVPIINCDSFINFSRLKPGIYEDINMCCNFGGDGLRTLDRARKMQANAPLFVTEYWIAAFDWWGRNGSAIYDTARALNGALEIVSGGAGGLTAFVFAGGAHFGYWHGRSICSDANFMTTLYGPGAPILDDGRFNEKYQEFKNHLSPLSIPALAQTGMPVVEEINPELFKATRTGEKGTFEFILNRGKEQILIADDEKDQACVDMSIPAGAVQWRVRDLELTDRIILKQTNLNIFAVDPALVLFGDAGAEAWVDLDDTRIDLNVPVDAGPAYLRYDDLDILVLNRESIKTCWRIEFPGAPLTLIGGPDRIEDVSITDGEMKLQVISPTKAKVWKLKDHEIVKEQPEYEDAENEKTVSLQNIQTSTSLPESSPDFDDSYWYSAAQPQPMAVFGHGHGWAWYRTTFEVTDGGPQTIITSGADDRAHVWVDGQYLGVRGWGSNHGWHLMPNLETGKHSLTILMENMGMFNSGAEFDIPLCEPKGLYGPVWLNGTEIEGWRMRSGLGAGEKIDTWDKPGGIIGNIPDEEKISGPVWLAAEFTMPENVEGAVRLELGEYAKKGSCWLNGKNVGRYWSIGPQLSLWLPSSWLETENKLVLFEESQVIPEKLSVSFTAFGPQSLIKL